MDVRMATAPQCSSVDVVRGGSTRDVREQVGHIDPEGEASRSDRWVGRTEGHPSDPNFDSRAII